MAIGIKRKAKRKRTSKRNSIDIEKNQKIWRAGTRIKRGQRKIIVHKKKRIMVQNTRSGIVATDLD